MPTPEPRARSTNHTLAIVFAIILIDMLGTGILIPVIPLLLTDTSYAYHLPLSLAAGYITLGFLTAIFPFMQFLATPILGQISDHVGRKPVLAFSLAGTSFSYVLFAVGIIFKSIPLLFVARAFDGVTGGNISVAQAAIADSTAPEKRARAFGIIGAAFGIGFIIGPFLGGELSNPHLVSWFNATTPFWFAAILSALNAIAVLVFFNETLKEKMRGRIHFAQSFINIQKAALSKSLRPLFATSFLYYSGFTFFTTFFGVLLIYKFGYDQGGIGLYFAFIGVCVALTQAFVTGFVGKRLKPYTILWISLVGVSVTLGLLAFVPYAWMLYAVGIPNCMFIGLIMANLTGVISRNAGPQEQGQVLGINSSVQALGQAIPPVISGYLAAVFAPELPIIVAGVIVLVSAIVYFVSGRAASTHEPASAAPAQ